MVATLWGAASKKLTVEMAATQFNNLSLNGEYSFNSKEHFEECYTKYINAAFRNVDFLDGLNLRPQIQEHLRGIKNTFMDSIDIINRYKFKEDFNWNSSVLSEDMYFDISHVLNRIFHM